MSRPTRGPGRRRRLRGCHPFMPDFPDGSAVSFPGRWPGPRSLATTDGVSLMSFPPGTEMFQFPGFAFGSYGFRSKYSHVNGYR